MAEGPRIPCRVVNRDAGDGDCRSISERYGLSWRIEHDDVFESSGDLDSGGGSGNNEVKLVILDLIRTYFTKGWGLSTPPLAPSPSQYRAPLPFMVWPFPLNVTPAPSA